MSVTKFAILITVPLALAGCKRGEDFVVLPVHHPAEPGGQAGMALGDTTALQPELVTVRATLAPAAAPASPSPAGGAHQHHHH